MNTPKCTLAHLGQSWNPDANPADVKLVEDYLGQFVAPNTAETPKCVCGKPLLGPLGGTFTWGLARGEGHCTSCKHPVRMFHSIRNEAGEECYSMTYPLSYHPELVVPCAAAS